MLYQAPQMQPKTKTKAMIGQLPNTPVNRTSSTAMPAAPGAPTGGPSPQIYTPSPPMPPGYQMPSESDLIQQGPDLDLDAIAKFKRDNPQGTTPEPRPYPMTEGGGAQAISPIGGATAATPAPPPTQGPTPYAGGAGPQPGAGGGGGSGPIAPIPSPMGAPGQSSPAASGLNPLLSNYAPDRVTALLDLQRKNIEASRAYDAKGPLIAGDQSQNPVGFAKFYNQRVKGGMDPAQALAETNAEFSAPGAVDRQGRSLANATQGYEQQYAGGGSGDYLQRIIDSGFLGPELNQRGAGKGDPPPHGQFLNPDGSPGPGGGAAGGAAGAAPGGIAPIGGTQARGTDFSSTLRGGLTDVIAAGGGPINEFGRGVESEIGDTIRRGGELDPRVMGQRAGVAQDVLNQAQGSNLLSMDATIADRGLMGSPAGERRAIENAHRDIAGTYANAFTDFSTREQEQSNSRYIDALGMGTGLTADQPRNVINASTSGSNRQAASTNAAVNQFEQDRLWSQYLSDFGFKRDQYLEDTQMGRISALAPLLGFFAQSSGTAAGGYY